MKDVKKILLILALAALVVALVVGVKYKNHQQKIEAEAQALEAERAAMLAEYEAKQRIYAAEQAALDEQRAKEAAAFALVTDDGSGTWVDHKTGLMWMRCSIGQKWNAKTCKGNPTSETWQNAYDNFEQMNQAGGYAGHTDWHLPNIEELNSLLRCNKGFRPSERSEGTTISLVRCKEGSASPTINQSIFPNTADYEYWSSSHAYSHHSAVWYTNFGKGFSGYIEQGEEAGVDSYSFRAVRDVSGAKR